MSPRLPRRVAWLGLILAWAVLAIPVRADDHKSPNPVDAIRKALAQPIALDYSSASLEDIVGHLKERTKINLVIDQMVLQSGTVDFNPNGNMIQLKTAGSKVRQALQQLLNPYNLTYVIVGESVLITTEEMAAHRQMRQRVSVDFDGVPVHKALRDLARAHGVSLVIDPRVSKEAQAKVSLQLEDAPLETSVRLLAEFGNLKVVRLGNVLLVTTEEKAEKLRREESFNASDARGNPLPVIERVIGGLGAGPAGGIIPGPGAPPPPLPPEKK